MRGRRKTTTSQTGQSTQGRATAIDNRNAETHLRPAPEERRGQVLARPHRVADVRRDRAARGLNGTHGANRSLSERTPAGCCQWWQLASRRRPHSNQDSSRNRNNRTNRQRAREVERQLTMTADWSVCMSSTTSCSRGRHDGVSETISRPSDTELASSAVGSVGGTSGRCQLQHSRQQSASASVHSPGAMKCCNDATQRDPRRRAAHARYLHAAPGPHCALSSTGPRSMAVSAS